MDVSHKTKLRAVRTQLVSDLGQVDSVLDVLVELHVISPDSDAYQKVLAGRYARERARLLLDVLPTLGARAFDAFVEALRRSTPHLADLLEKVSGEFVCDGVAGSSLSRLASELPSSSGIQNKLRKTYMLLGRKAKAIDHRSRTAAMGLDQLSVTISSLTFDEAQAQFRERKTRSGWPVSVSELHARSLVSKTFASRCQDAIEQSDVGQLFRRRNGAGLVDSCLIVGPAGAGKSVLLQRVAVAWAEERVEELSQFELVVLLSGRDAEALKCTTPVTLLGCVLQRQYSLSDAERSEVEMYIERNTARVLVLLDSADEGGEAWVKSKALEMQFDRRGLEDCTFVVTTRPCSLGYDLVPLCEHRFYLVGFNDRRLDELISRRLGADRMLVAEKLKEPTRQHVRELMKGTPLVANMVVELALEGNDTFPSSCSQIYKAIAANMVQRQSHKTGVRQEQVTRKDVDMFACLPADVKEVFRKLGQVALAGLCKRQLVFNADEVVGSCGGEVIDFGFLVEFELESMSHGTCREVEFRHLTWAEFFAAYALSRQIKPPFRALQQCADIFGVSEEKELFLEVRLRTGGAKGSSAGPCHHANKFLQAGTNAVRQATLAEACMPLCV